MHAPNVQHCSVNNKGLAVVIQLNFAFCVCVCTCVHVCALAMQCIEFELTLIECDSAMNVTVLFNFHCNQFKKI